MPAMQDLVAELSKKGTWYTPRKTSQQAYERNADGSFTGFEEEVRHLFALVQQNASESFAATVCIRWC